MLTEQEERDPAERFDFIPGRFTSRSRLVSTSCSGKGPSTVGKVAITTSRGPEDYRRSSARILVFIDPSKRSSREDRNATYRAIKIQLVKLHEALIIQERVIT